MSLKITLTNTDLVYATALSPSKSVFMGFFLFVFMGSCVVNNEDN